MAHFMVGDPFLLHLVEHPVPLLQPGHDPLYRFLQFRETDLLLATAHSQECRLVDDIGEIGARETGGHRSDHLEIRIGAHDHLLRMDAQDSQAADLVRTIDQYLTIEAAGPQQCGIQNLRPVGRRHQNDADAGIEAIHLDQQLIQGLLPLFMRHRSHAARFSDRIQFIDENDAGRFDLRLLEEIPYTGCSDSHKHFHELGAADTEKGHAGLSCHGPGQEGLAGAWRADE